MGTEGEFGATRPSIRTDRARGSDSISQARPRAVRVAASPRHAEYRSHSGQTTDWSHTQPATSVNKPRKMTKVHARPAASHTAHLGGGASTTGQSFCSCNFALLRNRRPNTEVVSRTADEETSARERTRTRPSEQSPSASAAGVAPRGTLPLPVKCASSVAGATPPPRRRLHAPRTVCAHGNSGVIWVFRLL